MLLTLLFFFSTTATTKIYTLSLHDALPIYGKIAERPRGSHGFGYDPIFIPDGFEETFAEDRKSTRLNSSHQIISYAVFCLKKKKTKTRRLPSATNHSHTTR